MKILNLIAENVKKLQVVEITPTGNIIEIKGRNGAGKTSVLDSIWWALAGTSHIQLQPIRKGQKKARIRLDLGEIIVERRFTESGSTLNVESVDGARYPSPQKMLDALIGELSFDPLAFARAEPKKQFDELRRVAKLELDVDKLNALNRGDFQRRTDINREAKQRRAAADVVNVPAELPAEPVDEAALVDEIQRAGDANAERQARIARREAAQRDVHDKQREAETHRQREAELREQARRLILQADEVQRRAADLEGEAVALQAKIDAAPQLPEPIDVSDFRRRLDEAKRINEGIRKRAERQRLLEEAKALEEQSKALTEQMEAREAAKAEAISKAALPVEGLGFGDGVVTYNGVPFEQASSAEQLRVSLAVAMAANPKLRVIRIQDGSLLDDANMATIREMAEAGDYQVWVERVDTSGKLGIIIEDGMVVASEPVEVAG